MIVIGSHYGRGDIANYDDWAAALELALLWGFEQVCEFIAARVKETGTLAEQIVTARRLDMQDWCWDVCAQLSQRREPLSIGEAQRLGMEDTVRISQVREKRRARPYALLGTHEHQCKGFLPAWDDPQALDELKVLDHLVVQSVKEVLVLPNASKARSPPYNLYCCLTRS